jgi:hypothetical protein
MKPINFCSLLQAKATLDDDGFQFYKKHYGIDIKNTEIDDLEILVKMLRGAGSHVGDLSNFYVGYKIPQIGKEFDLLRFGQDAIINIELKSICSLEKIRSQLQRNQYYLNSTGKTIYAFTFVASTEELYTIDESDQLETVDPIQLAEVIANHVLEDKVVPNELFNPTDFLVSPFNSTEKFIAQEYFLTQQQEEIKNLIIASIGSKQGPVFIAITGDAGTGKTLLTFDIARHLNDVGINAQLIHCGQLNSGHYTLINLGWNICEIKNYTSIDFTTLNIIIIDEAQRIRLEQFQDIVTKVKQNGCGCIFSFDKSQTLSKLEASNDIAAKIDDIISIPSYKLSTKIRTNKAIADFTRLLFNKNKTGKVQQSENIQLNYFSNYSDFKYYLNGLSDAEWKILRFTPSRYDNEYHANYYNGTLSETSHQVIGQEFDSVAIAMDNFFRYNDEGDLVYVCHAHYAPAKMLFQNITRARRRLNLVLFDNKEVLNRCLSILE